MEKKQRQKGKAKTKLDIKELEKKVLPSVAADKKIPYTPHPPYAPGTDYGLATRANLLRFNS